ncbi:MAG: hypothetical protein HY590_03075, partial [Candidatus Omnitrophica bacterium]|nr:hypothetical protein [Candidatus Omnitrophota bacterium]
MGSRQKKKVPYLYKGRGPGLPPALSIVVMAYLVFAFLDTQPAFPLDFKSFQPYTTPSGGGDARVGSGDSQFDAQRVIRRNLLEQRQKKEEKTRGEEKQQSTQQTQEVEQNVVQTQRVSQAIAQQGEREADFIYNRTTGLDSYSVDKDGGVWRQHLSLLVEAWNVLSRDLFGNGSRSHLTDFKYNDLLNATGMKRETKDQAGRATETVISGITYMPGQSPRNFLSQNKEAKRAEVTTTFHPTGNQVTQTELYDLVYDGDNVVAQKARITDLSGPTPVVIQETTGITYDGESNVSASHTRVTDLETGIVTESDIKNEFSDHRLISGVTKSVTKDSINHTFTEQTFTQKVSYGDSGIQTIDARSIATTQAMDEKGNPVDDFVQTTETLQKMGLFFNIPNPVEVSSVTKTVDNVGVQTTESKQMQRQLRDDHGNLLGISATEVATTVNADRSVVQETKSNLDFMVRADQPYLIGREDNTFTKDLINEQNIFTTSRLRIQLGALGEVLEGFRTGKTHAANGDGSIVSDSEFTQTFDRASKVNALGLVKQETSSRTVNTIDESVSTETRLYTQTHDEMNRVLSAAEAVKGLTTNSRGGETHVEGAVDYAIGKRTNQAYAISSTNNITSKDLGNRLYTESVQTNAYASDENTGRAIG